MMQVSGLWAGGYAQARGTGRQFTSEVTHHKSKQEMLRSQQARTEDLSL